MVKKDFAKRFYPLKFEIRYSILVRLEDSAVRCLIQVIAVASLIIKKTAPFWLSFTLSRPLSQKTASLIVIETLMLFN